MGARRLLRTPHTASSKHATMDTPAQVAMPVRSACSETESPAWPNQSRPNETLTKVAAQTAAKARIDCQRSMCALTFDLSGGQRRHGDSKSKPATYAVG